MNIIEKNIRDLIPYENNPRNNEKAVEAVAASISNFGFKVPIVIDKNNVIVAGHTRAKAAKKLGIEKVPVIIADDLTEEQVRAFRLADNKTGELAEWDLEKLSEELAGISEINMESLGFVEEKQEEEPDTSGAEEEVATTYHTQHGVIVMCTSEVEQEAVYNELTGEGYDCRVVAT